MNDYSHFSLKINPAFKLLVTVIIIFILIRFISFDAKTLIFISGIGIISLILSYKLRKYFVAYLFGCLVVSSLLNLQITQNKINFTPKFHVQENALFNGEILEIISTNDYGATCLIEGDLDLQNYSKINSRGVIYIYGATKYFPSDLIKGSIKVNPSKPRQTIYDFDESNYLLSKNTQFRCFAFANNISKTNINNSFDKWLYLQKEAFISYLRNIFEYNNAGIVTAFLTGNKSYIDRNIREDFSLTGTAHLLAVSGFHIGLLSFVLWIFLKMIKNPIVIILAFVLIIGTYVMFTGSSPSALRAGLMGVLVVYCYSRQWQFNMMNIFSAAVLINLFMNPFIIFSVSFQLSVSAVFGIIGFYPIISTRIFMKDRINSRVVKRLIDTISVSIAAAVFVAPVSSYYFNNYPVYSVLANLIAIPLTSLSMAFSIMAVIASLVSDYLANSIGFIAEILLELTKKANSTILSLDYSVISGSGSFSISILILSIFLALSFSKKVKHLIYSMMILSPLIINHIISNHTTEAKTYERQYYRAEIKREKNKVNLLIAEYNFMETQRPDSNFEKYLESEYDSLNIICYEPAFIFSESFFANKKINIIREDKYIPALDSNNIFKK